MRGLTPEANPAEMCDIIAAMLFQVRIQNLGKLADATVRIGGLTVLAGANSTGKTFFSKFLYSTLEAMGKGNLVTEHVQEFTNSIISRLSSLEAVAGKEKIPDLAEIAALARELGEWSESIAPDDGSLRTFFPDFIRLVEEASAKYRDIMPDIERMSMRNGGSPNGGESIPDRLKRDFDWLSRLAEQSGLEITLGKINGALAGALLENFQVSDLSDLQGSGETGIAAEVIGVGSLVVSDSSASPPSFDPALLQLTADYPGLIYLESPALWKLRVALEDARRHPQFGQRHNGVPRYFYDLANTLQGNFSGKVAFPKVLEQLTGKQGIGGKIVLDSFGNMLFHEEKASRAFPLTATAMGVANLGILALLIERKILDKGTFLFIDEPESNLHPEWQVKMTEALWELARGGVNVVIATHGVDILKRLDIYAKEEKEEAEKILAVNHFQSDGIVQTVQSGGVEMIRDVKQDLSAPFFKLYKRGLR